MILMLRPSAQTASSWQCFASTIVLKFRSATNLIMSILSYVLQQGSSLKILLQRCKHLTCLMLQQTGLVGEQVSQAEWDKAGSLSELDITATDLSTQIILDILTQIPALTWLSAGQLDGMNDDVLNQWVSIFINIVNIKLFFKVDGKRQKFRDQGSGFGPV